MIGQSQESAVFLCGSVGRDIGDFSNEVVSPLNKVCDINYDLSTILGFELSLEQVYNLVEVRTYYERVSPLSHVQCLRKELV